jgi:uncharacterized protein YozE (UPF0346 family)
VRDSHRPFQNNALKKNLQMITSFKTWIQTQTERNDPVGRLARNVNIDTGEPKGPWKTHWLDHLALRSAGPDAEAAFEKAWEEYSVSFLDKYR